MCKCRTPTNLSFKNATVSDSGEKVSFSCGVLDGAYLSHNDNNYSNSRSSIAPYGCNCRGTGKVLLEVGFELAENLTAT